MRELLYALRRLRNSPVFTIAATLTLAIAIGATASVFSLVDGVLFKAFPYRDLGRVFTIWQSNPERHQLQVGMANATYFDFLAQNTTFTTLAVGDFELQYMVTRSQDAERVIGMPVTASLFQVLGITPALGRPLSADSAAPPEVMLSYEYWQRRFGGKRSVLGETMTLDNPTDPSLTPQHTYTIVGVLPPGLPGHADLWTRMIFDPDNAHNRTGHAMHVFGQLKPGVTPQQALADLQTIAARLATAYPQSNAGWSVRITPFIDQIVGPVRPALAMLLGAAACVLLIGAANLANLFLVRCLSREREMALRIALGATRRRLVAELVTEAGVLAVVAGALGVGLAVLGVRVLRVLGPSTLPRLADIGVDGRVVAFCAVASFATVLLFGVIPAWQASRGSLGSALKEGGRGTGSASEHRLQNSLVVLQVAIALVLLTGASLLVESFARFRRMDPGFRPAGVLTAQISLPTARYSDPVHQAAFILSVPEHLAVQPGVQSATVSNGLPGRERNLIAFSIVGDAPPDAAHAPSSQFVVIGPDYFRTMGIPLLSGRSVLSTDDQHSARVAIVDDMLAKRYFAGRDPLGHRLALLYGDTVRIVGVVASVKQSGLAADDHPGLYLPYAQDVD